MRDERTLGYIERAASGTRAWLPRGLGRVRSQKAAILQTTAAAVVAWWVARLVLPERPVFAPLAAIVALGASRGERGQRALQVSLGVAVGIAAAELIIRLLGTGTLVLALVTGLALVAAVFVFEASTFVVQAGVSAALVVTVASPKVVGVDRLVEALVGCGVALLVSQVLFPPDTTAKVSEAARIVLMRLADGLDCAAHALRSEEPGERQAARASLRCSHAGLTELQRALRADRQAARVSRPRRHRTARLPRLDGIDELLEATVSSVESLLVVSARLGQDHELVGELAAALQQLAQIARQLAADAGPGPDELAERARAVTGHAAAARGLDPGAVVATLVTLIRSIARGLLQAGGVDAATADETLGHEG